MYLYFLLYITYHVQRVRFAQIIGIPENYVFFAVRTTNLLSCVVNHIIHVL